MKNVLAVLVLALAAIGLTNLSGCSGAVPSAMAQTPTPPTTPGLTGASLTIGDITLSPASVNNGPTWSALDYVPTVPAVRSELRLFPMNGTNGQNEPGGELTLSQWDLKHINGNGDYQLLAIYPYTDGYRFQSQAGGSQKPLPILFDAMHGEITFAVNANGTVGIKSGISNTQLAGGFAHQRTPSCSGASCQAQVVWQTAFSDTNYTVTCSLGNAVGTVNWSNKSTGGLVAVVTHTAGSDGGEIDCIGVHD